MALRDIPKEAAYCREALRLGAASVADVVSWSDLVIAESPMPDIAFIQLSSMGKASPLDVLHVLQALSETVSALEALPEVLALAHAKLAADPGYARVLARALYGIYVSCGYEVPEELRDIGWFDDAFDLAEQGTYGTADGVREELLRFTKQFAECANDGSKPTAPPWPRSDEPAA
jgi:hypothetical protein